jgi:hypothetical protein
MASTFSGIDIGTSASLPSTLELRDEVEHHAGMPFQNLLQMRNPFCLALAILSLGWTRTPFPVTVGPA